MKLKYLEICFRLLKDDFINGLTEAERNEFYKLYPLLKIMESPQKMDDRLKNENKNMIEYWITIIIDFLATKQVSHGYREIDWYKANLKKCKWL